MQYIAIVTNERSDFSALIESVKGCCVQYIKPDEMACYDLHVFDAICLLFGGESRVLDAPSRIRIEEQIALGKKVFTEGVNSISHVYAGEPVSTRFKRLVYVGGERDGLAGLGDGDILEDQCNTFTAPFFSNKGAVPLLVYKDCSKSHAQAEATEEDRHRVADRALWLEKPNLMICMFSLSNLVRARFSPFAKWEGLIGYLLYWLTGERQDGFILPRAYRLESCTPADFHPALERAIALAVGWFDDAGMLLRNGMGGVLEGLGTEIHPDGTQKIARAVRADCAGEASLAFFSHYLLTRNPLSLEKSNHLEAYCFQYLQIPSGLHEGMLRWTEQAWEVSYQDDAARVLIPSLLKTLYTGDARYLASCRKALDFLMKTTGPDGLRVARTDNIELDESAMAALAEKASDFPSPHYNAYYMAALFLAGKLTGEQAYIDMAATGMASMLKLYPNTRHEMSETEDLCRLVLPLAYGYWATNDEVYKEFLYRVCGDLQKMRHESGGYLEWDSGYTADLSRTENAECSMLTHNGDPVVDLLYSNNFLPLAFIQAYLVTGDAYFRRLWEDSSAFLIKAQLHSDNPRINGAWARGFDVEKMEVFGIPNDIGWGPWAVESGWTVGEIASGLAIGAVADTLRKYYR